MIALKLSTFPFRRMARDFCYTMVFNVACALVVTYVLRGNGSFISSLIISTCIGTTAFLLIDGIRLAIWGEDARPNWPVFALLVFACAPFAQIGGGWLAGKILGYELKALFSFTSPGAISSLVLTLIAAGCATVFFAHREKVMRAEAELAQEKARTETVARQALQAQLQSLQAQIEPHMLFNTLANLQGLIAIDPPRAQHMLDLLIQYLRATLVSSRAGSNTLEQEFAQMDAYLGLMQIRMGERLSYSLDLPPALRAHEVPPMLLQPLVENAIAHGLEPKIEGGHVTVGAALHGGALALTVQDSGRGPAAGPGKKGTHVGLSNTRERLRALYGEHASLTLEPAQPEGALARITLPV
ncbi:MAG: histidine kinase [Burkholderiaceae bacterium]|nr:histidine kinase [Burkholderiaceae bacterium]